MKKILIAFSCACASACVFADVGATPSKVTTNTWFSASVGETTLHTNGCSITRGTPTYADGKIVIDSELDSPVTFTADPPTEGGKNMTTVSFQLETAVVPADARQNLTNANAKVAFAASETTGGANAYFAWLGGQTDDGWVQLANASVKADNVSYTLDVTFDNRGNDKKVQFKVDGVALTYGGTNWLSYASDKVSSTELAIDLVGSGNVTSITGNQLTIVAEVVPLAGGATIQVSEADMMAFETTLAGTDYTTVDAFLAASAKAAFSGTQFAESVTVAEAYAIGLVTNNTTTGTMVPVDNGEIKVKADAQADVNTGIQVALNITPLDSSDTGATVMYQLKGSIDGENYSVIQLDGKDWVDSAADIVIPTSAVTTDNMHFFKVVTQVTLESASN